MNQKKIEYDNTKYFSYNRKKLFRKEFPIHLVLAPKECGKTYDMFHIDAMEQIEKGKKFVIIRNNQKTALSVNLGAYIPNAFSRGINQSVPKIYRDLGNGKFEQIGAIASVNTIENIHSIDDWKNYTRIYWDEFNSLSALPKNFYFSFCTMISDIQRDKDIKKDDFQIWLIGNKYNGDHDLLVQWGISFDNENKLQEQLVYSKSGKPLVQALFLPTTKIKDKSESLGELLSEFDTQSNAFFGESAFFQNHDNYLISWENTIKNNLKWNIEDAFIFTDMKGEMTKIGLIRVEIDKDTYFYYCKLINDYDDFKIDYKAINLASYSGNTLNLGSEDVHNLFERLLGYKTQNRLFYDWSFTKTFINSLINGIISMDK